MITVSPFIKTLAATKRIVTIVIASGLITTVQASDDYNINSAAQPSTTVSGISASADVSTEQDTSREIKVISLTPEISDILVSIGAESSLVAADVNSELNPDLNIPRIADYYSVNLEALSATKFDYIMVNSDFNNLIISKLKKFEKKLKIYTFSNTKELLQNIREIGELINKSEKAAEVADHIQNITASLISRNHASNRKPKNVAVVIWDRPLMIAGGTTFLSHAVELCGGHNVFADINVKFPVVSGEKLLLTGPDLIIALTDSYQHLPQKLQSKTHTLTTDEQNSLMKVSPKSFDIGIPAICRAINSSIE